MVYGYIRVSSDKQTVENQRGSVESVCRHIRQKGEYCIDDGADIRFFEEKWKDTDSTGTLCEE